MNNMIPPPILMLLFGVAMWFVAKSEFAYPIAIPFALFMAIAVAALGIAIAVTAIRQFSTAETTINPLEPESASALVQSGIFGKSRNPMYVGLVLDLCAWAIWLQSLTNIALLVLFVVMLTAWQIRPEEAAMRKLFGSDYDDYCKRVGRWF